MKNHKMLKNGYYFVIIFFIFLATIAITDQSAFGQLTEADCRVCHDDPNIVGPPSNVDRHHLLVGTIIGDPNSAPDGNPGEEFVCLTCHRIKKVQGVYEILVERDCVVCHEPAGHEEQHDQTFLPSPDCAECHVGNVVTEHVINRGQDCDICHNSTDPNVQQAITNGINGIAVFCADCHGADAGLHEEQHDQTFLPSSECAECHVGNVVTEHVINRGFDCNVCHDSTDPDIQQAIENGQNGIPVFCGDCHGEDAGLHVEQHDNAVVPYIDCSQCHAPNVVVEHVFNMHFGCGVCHDSTNQVIQNTIAQGEAGITVFCANCHVVFGNHIIQHDRTEDNVVTVHEGLSLPVYCFECHVSTDQLVLSAIDRGTEETFVPCADCHQGFPGPQNFPPVANAGPDQTVQTGQLVNFSGAGSSDTDGSIVNYAWDFDDGLFTGSGVSTSYTYNIAGTYTVTLAVTDNDGAVDADTVVITVQGSPQNQPPVADAGPDHTVQEGQSVSCSGSGSSDPDGTITNYAWDFGDSTTGSGLTTTHTYNATGTYTITLTVTDNDGATATDTAIVTVNVPTQTEICNDGIDNDGDGLTDCEDSDCDGETNGSCSTGQPGECSTGTLTCQSGAEVCVSDNQPQAEVCDNLDNDCDGSVDEDLMRPTTCGVGECSGNTGAETCTAGTWGGDSCDPFAGAQPEGPEGDPTCIDMADNDCDGSTDGNDSDCTGGSSGGIPGDCNGDGIINAGDITALVLEIFDGDGNLPADAPGGTFPGDPVGSDANEDGIINAGDITCTVLIIFNGPGACGGGAASASAASLSTEPLYSTATAYQEAKTVPTLNMLVQIPAAYGQTVTVPLNYHANGNAITALSYLEKFESGVLGREWTRNSTGKGRIQVTTDNSACISNNIII